MTTMPAVVLTPRTRRSVVFRLARAMSRGVSPTTMGTAMSAAMTRTLLTTGAQAAAKNRRRAFNIAEANAVTP